MAAMTPEEGGATEGASPTATPSDASANQASARRTLDRPPSDRYRSRAVAGGGEVPREGISAGAQGDASDADRPAGAAAPELQAGVVAIVGAALLVLVGGVLAFTTGLLFVSGVTAAAIGLFLAGSSRSRTWVRNVAIGTSVVVVLIGAVGAWLVGLAEGGNIGLLDFLWATTGLLVPAELVIAVLAAAWGAGAGPIRA
jgi:hypothetical protein